MRPDGNHEGSDEGRRRKVSRPLEPARFEEMALAYVARFATSKAKLAAYLTRKLRERGWVEDGGPPPDPAAVAERFVQLGYIDDGAYARMKSGGLQRRGYGGRRIAQALHAAGIGETHREQALPSPDEAYRAALVMARKRRFGPWSAEVPDRARREKQVAAMLRAGHALDIVRNIVDAASEEAAEEWCAAAGDD